MSAGGLTGTCHCGAVTIDLPASPEYLTRCTCSLCTKTGATWGYYDPATVRISGGALHSYVRADLSEACLSTDRCATCGCVIGWRDIRPSPAPRMGVNMNMVEPEALAGIETRAVDGRSWPK